MTQPLPPGQGPIDPRTAFNPPPPPQAPRGPGGPAYGPGPTGPGPIPPQYSMPFPPTMFGPPPPRRGRAGWIVVTVVLLLLLGGSVLLNLLMIGMAAGSVEGRQISQTTLVDGSSDQQIAVVSLGGVITDATRQKFDAI